MRTKRNCLSKLSAMMSTVSRCLWLLRVSILRKIVARTSKKMVTSMGDGMNNVSVCSMWWWCRRLPLTSGSSGWSERSHSHVTRLGSQRFASKLAFRRFPFPTGGRCMSISRSSKKFYLLVFPSVIAFFHVVYFLGLTIVPLPAYESCQRY